MVALLIALLVLQQPIIPDDPISIMVGTDPVDLIYTSAGAEYITITPRDLTAAEALDLIVEVRRGTQRIAYHDVDAAPTVADLLLSEPGDYSIRVHTFNGVQVGSVEVVLTRRPRLLPCEPGEIALAAQTAYTCWLDLEAGQQVTLSARDTSGTLDPVLRLYAADEELLVLNDDHGTFSTTLNVLDALIAEYGVAETGRYRVQVSDFSGAAGTLDLYLDRAG